MKRLLLPFLLFFAGTSVFAQGNALHFDGVDDYIQISDYTIGGEFTISFWYKASNFSNGNYDDRIISFGPNRRLEIGLGEADCDLQTLWFFDQIAGLQDCYTVDTRDGEWHHIAFTMRGPNRIFYFDGNIIGGYLGDTDFAYGPNLRIGAWTGALSTHTFFSGTLDELRIWSEARTQVQIQEYMNCEMTGQENCLDTYYSFNEGIDGADNSTLDSLFDQATGSRHGELRNFGLNGNLSNWVSATSDLNGPCENVSCLTTSTSELIALSVDVFPNPSAGRIELRSQLPQLARYRLNSLNGQLIQQGFLDRHLILDIQDQPDGLYLLEVIVGDEFYVTKLVKQAP